MLSVGSASTIQSAGTDVASPFGLLRVRAAGPAGGREAAWKAQISCMTGPAYRSAREIPRPHLPFVCGQTHALQPHFARAGVASAEAAFITITITSYRSRFSLLHLGQHHRQHHRAAIGSAEAITRPIGSAAIDPSQVASASSARLAPLLAAAMR
ncbi:uncharacterized protein PAN0_005d2490 [Moesziomyces antarcticus]|uniref:Uncharacterized protein n=1 Tax=Pseudozyma antarctica TaxID=84753 RepID=A0A081CC82_PSEA2|nr:uncharacterized protein PAN0_005d2490 [Moesziomyces antarcticus]GAK64278.1 hypothetical protein PAN0_005d2490 [Moesziomyces antarcticus]